MSNWRSKKLRESAKHESCVACGADDSTIVWAHSNSQKHGKGMGIKAHDLFGAYLCHKCHSAYDSNEKIIKIKCGEPEGEIYLDKDTWFHSVWERSMILACEKGYL